MSDLTSNELIRRLRTIAAHVDSRPDVFEADVQLEPGAGAAEGELSEVEADLGVTLPESLRGAIRELAGTCWHWSLREELEDDWDADVTGAHGGSCWLTPEEMRESAARLAKTASKLDARLLPFARDAAGTASWLAVANLGGKVVIVQTTLDGRAERWTVDAFVDDWSRGGFRVGDRWEDQPETAAAHFGSVLGLADDDDDDDSE